MTLRQATERRLMDIRSTFESELTEHTGKLRYHAGTRTVSGRIGGVKRAFPETERVKAGPKAIAAAIRRGRGKMFRQIHAEVEAQMLRKGFKATRSGTATIDPHKGKRYCVHCRQKHTKGQHRFHGKGSFQQTHLFSFGKNPNMQGVKTKQIRKKWIAGYRAYRYEAIFHGKRLGWYQTRREAAETLQAAFYEHPELIPEKKSKNPPVVKIYGKVLRIEAQKTGKHLCDSACKKANHRYYHDFRVKPSMYGLPDGSLLIKK